MRRCFLLAVPLSACATGSIGVDGLDDVPGEGWADGPIAGWDTGGEDDEGDGLPWDHAVLRIQSPRSASVVPIEEPFPFEVTLRGPTGPLPLHDVSISWSSQQDASWLGLGATFMDESLDVGIHTITAKASLPNGSTVSHSVGAVLVQSAWAGTYGGLYKVDVTAQGITVACTGSTTVVVHPYGDSGEGQGTCLVSILGFDLPLTWVFQPEIDVDGQVAGTVGVSGFGLFTYDFPAEGTIGGGSLQMEWAGSVPLVGPIDGYLTAPRISIQSF